MEKTDYSLHISKLIVKSFHDKLTPDEQAEMASWLSEPGHKSFYDSLRHRNMKAKKEQIRQLHPGESWHRLERRLRFKRKSPVLSILKYAAVFLLPLLTVAVLYYHDPSSPEQVASHSETILPGSSKATLILPDGQHIALQTDQNLFLQNDTTVQFNTRDNTLQVEKQTHGQVGTENYQTLSIPVGGEYRVILSDGTKIRLNSDTRLKFPGVFNNQKRVVYLEGEAYFEVAPSATQPFIVKTPEMDIQVLGTKFNVKAYAEDDAVYTTLAEGAVQAKSEKNNTAMVLSPDQQCRYLKNTGKMEKHEVDAQIYTGWTEGKFIFENETLEEIMKQLNRWYDTRVSYQNNEVRDYRFTGIVDRFDNIKTILDMMEKTYHIQFNIQGREIFVK